jgi:DNA mismatch repair protein MutS2
MDAHTLDLLEFPKIRTLVSGYAFCSLGKDLAAQAEPSNDTERIRRELALVSEMVVALSLGQSPPLGGLHDIRLTVRRAAIGAMLTAEQLLEIADTLTCTGNIYRYRTRLDAGCQRLIALLTPVEDLGMIAKTISGFIDSRGHVLDMASPELAKIRQQLANIEERVQHQMKRLLRDPELRRILRYPNATVSGDHYVLPVAVNFRHKIQGVVHRTSSTGETLFVEPASIAALSAERIVFKGDEDREIKRVLRKLSADVGRIARPLNIAIDILAQLDYITARARFSRDFQMSAPDINTEGRLWLRQARHPLLEALVRSVDGGRWTVDSEKKGDGGPRTADGNVISPSNLHQRSPNVSSPPTIHQPPSTVVPIDIRLGHGFNLLVITGPNTGGKTVTLKTAGLLCAMTQSGMHIPAAEGSTVPVFNDIFADIGDEQSLEQSLSTFSSHISRIAGILKSADAKCLVLLDELGAGTDPTEGAALGRAILDELDRIGCRAMVTTHIGDLKTYAFHNQRAENAAVEFDAQTLRPTFRLLIGQFGMSNALQIARRLQMPRRLLARAKRYLLRKQKRAPEVAQLQKMREQAEKAREEALLAQQEAERQREEYRQKLLLSEREAAEAAALRESRARLQPDDEVNVPRFEKPGRVVRIDHRRNTVVVSVGLGQWEVSIEEVYPVAGEPEA